MERYYEKFDPVEFIEKTGGFVLKVYGREYEFMDSIMPTKITTVGESILYAPVKLVAKFGSQVGQWQTSKYYVYSYGEEQCVLLLTGTVENIIANVTVTIEVDGFVKYDLKVINTWGFRSLEDGTPRMTELYIDVPVKKGYSSLFHFWPNAKVSTIPSSKIINTGKTESTAFPFKPYIWTGWDKGGLGIFLGESDKNFELADEEKCIEVTQGECTNIRIHLLDQIPAQWQGRSDKWVDALNPISFVLGFQATPVKRLPSKKDEYYKRFHLCCDGSPVLYLDDDTVKMCSEAGVKCIILHQTWSAIQNYSFAENEPALREFITKCHNAGMKVLPYFGYEFATNHPLFTEKADQWLGKNANGNFTGGWLRKYPHRAFMACYNGGYSDVLVESVIHAMEYYGFDGLYTDSTHVPWECCNESHGCGYRDKDGKLHPTFPVFAVRELARKLYIEVHKRGGIVDTHQSSCCMMPILSFVDSYYDAENIQESIRKDLRFLNFDAFVGEFMGVNMGLVCNLIAYTSPEMPIEALTGISLVHNVFPRPVRNNDLAYLSKVWRIFDTYDLDNAEFIPYFENISVTPVEEDAFVSLYVGEKEQVAVVCDLVKGRDSITVNCGEGYNCVEELLSGNTYQIMDGKVKLDSAYGTLKIYRFVG